MAQPGEKMEKLSNTEQKSVANKFESVCDGDYTTDRPKYKRSVRGCSTHIDCFI